jgi:membrane associated rhomboid family serine protease
MMRRIGTMVVPTARPQFSTVWGAAGRRGLGSAPMRRYQCVRFTGGSMVLRNTGASTQIALFSNTPMCRDKKPESALGSFNQVQNWKEQEEQKHDEESGIPGPEPGYLPFPPPFHTFNVISLLLIGNVIIYLAMQFSNDDVRDKLVEHFTLSHENAMRIYPFFTHAFYQENLLQLAIDSWLLMQFGRTMFGFLGGTRLLAFWAMCQVGGGLIHVGRQYAQLYYDMDPLEVRGRCYGANPFILGLVGVEGLIFRNLNFLQNPPVPFLVLTAFVMVIDIWRIFTTKPEEHGASTGGALVAYIFWALPTRRLGLDKLTAKM